MGWNMIGELSQSALAKNTSFLLSPTELSVLQRNEKPTAANPLCSLKAALRVDAPWMFRDVGLLTSECFYSAGRFLKNGNLSPECRAAFLRGKWHLYLDVLCRWRSRSAPRLLINPPGINQFPAQSLGDGRHEQKFNWNLTGGFSQRTSSFFSGCRPSFHGQDAFVRGKPLLQQSPKKRMVKEILPKGLQNRKWFCSCIVFLFRGRRYIMHSALKRWTRLN